MQRAACDELNRGKNVVMQNCQRFAHSKCHIGSHLVLGSHCSVVRSSSQRMNPQYILAIKDDSNDMQRSECSEILQTGYLSARRYVTDASQVMRVEFECEC